MSLARVARHSAVHQILLSHGGVDRIPGTKIDAIKSAVSPNHTLWLEADIESLLIDNFDPEVLEAFNKIKPLAYKADLARYCILYVHGGWYFDLTSEVIDFNLLDRYSEDFQVIMFRDVPSSGIISSVGNTVLWFRHPGHQILLDAINTSVSNILNKKYSHHQHGITGPIVLGAAAVAYQENNEASNILVGDTIMLGNHPSHVFNDPQVAEFSIFSRRRAMDSNLSDILPSGYESNSDYWKMYYDRTVY